MITVSLCMIVKNEERTLRRCLDSVRGLMDEIIIADTGSTDRTVEIARDCGAAVCTFPWCDDFAAARNFAFSKATMQYCMWLDADDVLEPADREAFRKLKETLDPDTDVVMLRYHTGFGERKPTFSYWRERLLRRARRASAGRARSTRRSPRPGRSSTATSPSATGSSARATPTATCGSSRGCSPQGKRSRRASSSTTRAS